MNVEIYINNVLQSNVIWNSFTITDNIDSAVNSCRFTVLENAPSVSDTVRVMNGATKIFEGEILDISRSMRGQLEQTTINAVDYTHNLGRSLIVERFTDTTVDAIITFLINKYHLDFTNLSDCDIEIKRVTFDNISVLDAIQQLAQLTDYRWFVDYDKNVRFFSGQVAFAPFNLTDTNGKYVYTSLNLVDDISQVRNAVKIRGGEAVGAERTESFDTDGTKDFFKLANKFSEMPTVVFDGTPVNVGVEYLDDEDSFDAFWNFNEKYIRFKVAPVAGTNNLTVTGTPLIPIIVRKTNNASIKEYGLREFFKWDRGLRSQEEAGRYADSQLEAFKNNIIEGNFDTYEDGLKSGQRITIQSDKRGIDDNFLIQRVSLKMRTPVDGIYSVELATTKTLDLIATLQGLLKTEKRVITGEQEFEPLITFATAEDSFTMDDELEDSTAWIITSPPYKIAPADPLNDNPASNYLKVNFGTIAAAL